MHRVRCSQKKGACLPVANEGHGAPLIWSLLLSPLPLSRCALACTNAPHFLSLLGVRSSAFLLLTSTHPLSVTQDNTSSEKSSLNPPLLNCLRTLTTCSHSLLFLPYITYHIFWWLLIWQLSPSLEEKHCDVRVCESFLISLSLPSTIRVCIMCLTNDHGICPMWLSYLPRLLDWNLPVRRFIITTINLWVSCTEIWVENNTCVYSLPWRLHRLPKRTWPCILWTP